MALIIKSLSVDPPNYEELSDDENDFVKDPAQFRDELPQPYRFIDSVLSQFLDEVWDEITDRENNRIAEKSKIRPPKYECSIQLQEHPNTKVLASSQDGRYVFVAFPGGLALFDAARHNALHTYEDERLDIVSMECTIIGAEIYLLTAIDELGLCRMYGSAAEKIFPVKVINEDHSKYHAVKFGISSDADYLGVVLENPSINDIVLEVYQLPRDAWVKEIENIKNQIIQSEARAAAGDPKPETPTMPDGENPSEPEAPQPDTIVEEQKSENQAENENENDEKKSTESHAGSKRNKSADSNVAQERHTSKKSQSARTQKPPNKSLHTVKDRSPAQSSKVCSKHRSPSDVMSASKSQSGRIRKRKRKGTSTKGAVYNFISPTAVMKQHAPDKLAANAGSSPAMTMKELGDPKVMGSGQNHLLTRAYLDIRHETFNHLHADMLTYKSPEEQDKHIDCNFHFFTPGLAIPYGLEQPGATSKPTCIGVWWTGSRQFVYYCLTKPVKAKKPAADGVDSVLKRRQGQAATKRVQISDLTPGPPVPDLELKAEAVWAQSSVITSTAISADSNLVAIGLENGIVTVWDKYLGMMRKCVNISKTSICKLDFIDPSACHQSNNSMQCYPTSTSCYVLVRCKDSSLHLLNCGMMDYGQPIMIADKAEDDDNVITAVYQFPKMPEIIIRVHKNGTVFLQDILSSNVLCEIALPSTHTLSLPWSPIITNGAFGQMLYIKGTQQNQDEHYAVENVQESIFVFQLRSFPTLDSYWMKKRPDVPYIAHSPIDVRVNALLTQRVKASSARKQRLQQRWPQMKQELLRIMQIKSH